MKVWKYPMNMKNLRPMLRPASELLIIVILCYALSIALFRSLIFTNGEIYYLDVGFPLEAWQAPRSFEGTFYLWSEYQGRSDLSITWVFNSGIVQMAIWIFGSTELASKFLYISIPALMGILTYISLRLHFTNHFACGLSAVFLLTSPWLLSHQMYGHLWVMLSVVMIIPTFSFGVMAIDRRSYGWGLLTAIVATVSIAMDQRNLVIIALLLLSFILVRSFILGHRNGLRKMLLTASKDLIIVVPIMIAVVAFSLFWILPLNGLLSGMNPYYPPLENLKGLSKPLIMNLIPQYPGWYEVILGDYFNIWLGFLIATFAGFIFSLIKPVNQRSLVFFFMMLIGIFLAKGAQDPFGELYVFFFNNVPYFSAFRNPTHFVPIILVSMAFLIPSMIGEWRPRMRAFNKKALKIVRPSKDAIKALFKGRARLIAMMLVIAIIFQAAPVMLTEDLKDVHYASTWAPNTIDPPQEYLNLLEFLRDLPQEGRYMAFPPLMATTYSWSSSTMYDPLRYSSTQPGVTTFYVGEDTVANDMGWFIYQMIYLNRTDMLPSVLGIMSVKWVVLSDATPEQWVIDSLAKMKVSDLEGMFIEAGFNVIFEQGNYSVLENPMTLPLISGYDSVSLICGDRRALISSLYNEMTEDVPFSASAFVKTMDSLPAWDQVGSVIAYSSQIDDLIMYPYENRMINAVDYLTRTENVWSTWVYDTYTVVSSYNQLVAVPENFAITYSSDSSDLNIPIDAEGTKEVWIRLMTSSSSNSLTVDFNSSDGIVLNFNTSDGTKSIGLGNFRWVNVGTVNFDEIDTASISSNGFMAISDILLLNPGEYQNAKNATLEELERYDVALVNIIEAESMFLNGTADLIDRTGSLSCGQGIDVLNDSSISQEFLVYNGSYQIQVRILAPMGGSVNVTVDDIEISLSLSTSDDPQWFDVGTLDLDSRDHVISVSTFGNITLDCIDVVPCSGILVPERVIIDFVREDPCRVSINSVDAKFIVFSECYSELWELNGVGSTPNVGYNNLFITSDNSSGLIIFTPQIKAENARFISIASLVIALVMWPASILVGKRILRKRNE